MLAPITSTVRASMNKRIDYSRESLFQCLYGHLTILTDLKNCEPV